MDGSLSAKSSPTISVEFYGATGRPSHPQVFDAIVDTGFTGSVSMPITHALPLGLILFSTASFVLADGSIEDTFLCLGTARLENTEHPVVISLTKGNDILIGTEFLDAFNAQLNLDYNASSFSLTVH